MFRRHVVRQGSGSANLGGGRWRRLATSALVVCVAVAVGPGCASKKSAQTTSAEIAAETGGPQADGSLHGAEGTTTDPNRHTRWAYSALPAPAPSSQPNYLLKSYRCDQGSATLNNEARGTLGQLIETLKERPSVRVVCLGMTDGHGERVNAENLAMNRAQAAKQYLVNQGIAKDRIETASFAATQAAAGADESIGQSEERRVEIWLLSE